MKYFLLVLMLLLPLAHADVVISKVLYDPSESEAGGEAVELWNMGDSPVDISGWFLSTASSARDASFPDTVILPGQRFLLADVGWDDKKDDPGWRSADYEEKITLGNSDSGVAISFNETIIDAVGWGDPEEYFSGQPADMVSSGMCLVRFSDTGDNMEDFTQQDCAFLDGITVLVEVEVDQGFSAWINSDDSNESGIQILPGNDIIVEATAPGNLTVEGKSFSFEEVDGSFLAVVDSAGLSSGSHTMFVNGISLDFEILPLAFVRAVQHKLILDPYDMLELQNLGSVNANVEIMADDLMLEEHKIDKLHLLLEGSSLANKKSITLKPGESKSLRISLDEFGSVPPGRYSSLLRITYGS